MDLKKLTAVMWAACGEGCRAGNWKQPLGLKNTGHTATGKVSSINDLLSLEDDCELRENPTLPDILMTALNRGPS